MKSHFKIIKIVYLKMKYLNINRKILNPHYIKLRQLNNKKYPYVVTMIKDMF